MSFFSDQYVESALAIARSNPTTEEEQGMEHTFTSNGIKIDTQISLIDAVAFGKMLAMQGFEQWLNFFWGVALESRHNSCTIPDLLSSFRAAMGRQSDEVLEEILPLVVDLSQQIERELQQRHNSGRGATTFEEIHHG